MTRPRPAPSVSPRWPVLALLVATVLGAHLVLLAGGITLNLPKAASDVRAGIGDTVDTTPQPQPTAQGMVSAPQQARVSTVRWIVPAAPSPHVEAVTPPPPKAKPPAVKAAPPRLPAAAPTPPPEPVIHAVASTPQDTSDAPAEAVAQASPATPEQPAEPTVTAQAPAAEPPAAPAPHAAALPPAQPPASTRLLYDVTGSIKGIGYKAQGTLDWTVTGARYEARMEMRVMLLGSRSQTSTGQIGPGGLMPERFADKSRSEKAAHFDAAQQSIRFSSNAPEVPLQPGAQDRLSLFLQLASLLQARPQAYTTGQTVDMQVAGTGDAPIWRFEVGEESTVSLPAGQFKVRHLVRQPRKEFDSTVEMWLAPSLHHLPVRLRVTQSNGDVADQQLSQMP